MKEILNSHCSIRSGITLRKNTSAPNPHSETYILKIKDIGESSITPDYSSPVSIDIATDKFRVHAGDTLFSSRGKTCKASVMPEHTGTFIAPSQLHIITPNAPSTLLPEFLALYLSSRSAEQFFVKKRKGSLVQIITKKSLSELPITIPPLAEQHRIIALHHLAQKESEISNKLLTLRVKQVEGIISATQH